ncbi:hypothetical protein GS416_08105 [Rhodococcus hoagii]|nr:hypothetical protein [Prescottella equi]
MVIAVAADALALTCICDEVNVHHADFGPYQVISACIGDALRTMDSLGQVPSVRRCLNSTRNGFVAHVVGGVDANAKYR